MILSGCYRVSGRNNSTGNVAQIYMSYIGNDDPANNFAIAFGGKSPVVQFFNDYSTKFSGRVLINTTSDLLLNRKDSIQGDGIDLNFEN